MSNRAESGRGSGAVLYGVFVAVLLTAVLAIATITVFPDPAITVTDNYEPTEEAQAITLYRLLFSLASSVVVSPSACSCRFVCSSCGSG